MMDKQTIRINWGRRIVSVGAIHSLVKWFIKRGFSVDYDHASGILTGSKAIAKAERLEGE